VTDVLLRLQGLNEQGFVIGEIVARKNDDPPLVYILERRGWDFFTTPPTPIL
jgi:hypothetical protein